MVRNTVPESVSMETPQAKDAAMAENARRVTAADPWLRFMGDVRRLGYGAAVDKRSGGLRPVYPELWLADASGAAQLARLGVRGLAAAIRGSVARSIPVDAAAVGRNALALESVRARHNLGNLRMWRNTDLEELDRVVRMGWQESPSIGVSRIDSPSYIMPTTGYNVGSGNVPVVFHYRRGAFDFDVRPGHYDVAIPRDSASPTSRTVAEELAAGKTYDDILRGWVDRQGGAGPGVGDITFANGSPRVMTNSEKAAKIKAEEAAMKELGIRRPYEDPRPQVATGNRLGETWDRIRMASDQWGEVKPLRKVSARDAVDFVEIPRYRYVRDPVSGYAREEWIPRGERFALQRRLEAGGIRYRTFDTSGFYGAGAPPGVGDYRPRMSEFLSGEARGPGVMVPRITPQAFHEDAKGGDTRLDNKGGKARKVPFDPAKDRLRVPKGREKEFEAYMDKLATLFNPVVWDDKNNRPVLKEDGKTLLGKDPSRPASNLVPPNWRDRQGKGEFDGDYDYVAAFLAGAEPGINPGDNAWHMGDVGKMPTHETFSNESYYARDPRWAPYAGRWEGETYIPPESSEVHQDAKGGDVGPSGNISPEPGGASVSSPAGGGPRIVINPTTFRNEKDALCVAFNEAFRIVMEDTGFEPVSEPTERQRRFFSDTAYANDETQLRRTILARICTFDTSVKDPTDEQLQEAVEFLDSVMEVGAPQNEWEQSAVRRMRDALAKTAGAPAEEPEPEPPSGDSVRADEGGGATEEEQAALRKRQEEERRAVVEAERRKAELAQDRADKEAARVQARKNNVAAPLDGLEGRIDAGSTTLGKRQLRDMARFNRSSASDRASLAGEFADRYGLAGLVNMEAGGNLSEEEATRIAGERVEDQEKRLLARNPGLDGGRLGALAEKRAAGMTERKMLSAASFAALDPRRQRIEAAADSREAARTWREARNVAGTASQRASSAVARDVAAERKRARDDANRALFADRRAEIEAERKKRFWRPEDDA